MAQSPTGGSNTPTSSGGGSKGGKSEGKSSSKGSSKSSKSRMSAGGGKDPLMTLANAVPSHHAHHGMSGEYSTKGKFGGWPDGNSAFGE